MKNEMIEQLLRELFNSFEAEVMPETWLKIRGKI
ncbi:MAG: hypothetical protein JWO09_3443 [Bacteroidetes bacterium]|nr:hypothetical protein [Bacteroidota bacterium]